MRKLISTALFGEGDYYAGFLGPFIRAHHNIFPQKEGWGLVVHVDDKIANSRHGDFLRKLQTKGLLEVRWMGKAILTKAMLWRLSPIFESESDYVFCRDIDYCPMPRDRACCEQFIVSKATVHVIYDNISHCWFINGIRRGIIMGGLCGFNVVDFKNVTGLKSLSDVYKVVGYDDSRYMVKGVDQDVLTRIVDRPGGPVLLEHRFSGWTDGAPGGPARPPSEYQCEAWSTLVPDVGLSPFSLELTRQADKLAPCLGASSFNAADTIKFYDLHGDINTTKQIKECETEVKPVKYSQNDEEEKIIEFFNGKSVGRFLDIGAHDGVNLSNTRKLAECGWGGVFVEPSPAPFLALMNNYKGREDVDLVNVAIVPGQRKLLKFFDSHGDFVSTVDESHRNLWANSSPGRNGIVFQPIFVSGIPVAELLVRFPGPYKFLNLDVEGINFEIFNELPLIDLQVELVCVEYQDKLLQIEEAAARQGFKRYHVTSENVLLVR